MVKTPILRYLSLLIVEKAFYVIDQILAITLITGSFMIIHVVVQLGIQCNANSNNNIK